MLFFNIFRSEGDLYIFGRGWAQIWSFPHYLRARKNTNCWLRPF